MGLQYTRMKIFHFKGKIDSLPQEVPDILPPIQVRIKPTNACNHNCWYCAYRADGLQLGQDMNERDFIPRGKMLEILDDIIEMGVKAVTFSGGGEPFCYPYLLESVKKLASSTVKFASLTNGARVTGEVAEIFAHHATWLRVSMDGWDDSSYREYRGCGEREFTKIVENMRTFKRLGGKCYLGVSYIVDQRNADHIFDLVRLMKDIGVDSVKISPCIVSNNGVENSKYHRPIFDLAKEQTRKAVDRLCDSSFEIYDSYHDFDDNFSKGYTWCPYSQILPVIGADQNIYPCQDKAYNLTEALIGSIKNTRFKDFWLADKSKFLGINPSTACNHHCVASEKNQLIIDYINADKAHLEFV